MTREIPLFAQGVLLLWLDIKQSERVDHLEDKPIKLVSNGQSKTIIIDRPEAEEAAKHAGN
jgi:hypothetical protein